MSRVIGRQSRCHVEASGRGVEDRRWAAVRHGGGGRVRDHPSASAPAPRSVPGRRPGGGRAAVAAPMTNPQAITGRGPRPDRRSCVAALTAPGLDAGRSRSPGTSNGRPARPVDLDDPPHPARRRADHSRAAQTTPLLIHPLRSRPAQRDLAVRLHPLAPADGTDVEILNWLDDHSRYLLVLHRPPTRSPATRRRHVPRPRR